MRTKTTFYHTIAAQIILLAFIFTSYFTIAQNVVLNEVMMKNENYQLLDGENSDWIELYNTSSSSIQLSNFYLTDKRDAPQKWAFPDSLLSPNQFIVIVASGKNTITPNFIHANFSLSANEEAIYLTDGITFLDSLIPLQTPTDLSFGRIQDGLQLKSILVQPSLGSSNGINNSISPSHTNAFFDSSFKLHLTSLNADTIYYTTNGAEPNPAATLYIDSIWLEHDITLSNSLSTIPTTAAQNVISYHAWEAPAQSIHKCHVLKYASFNNGIQTSPVYAQTFIPQNQIGKLNVVSILVDSVDLFDYNEGIYVPGVHFQASNPEWTGNFFKSGQDWEKDANILYINEAGATKLNQKIELKISGGKTRQTAQKSLAISAKSHLGGKFLQHNFFPQRKAYLEKSIVLKTAFGDWEQQSMMKDILVHAIASDLHLKTLGYEFVDVYINGEYWGIQAIRERNSSSNLGLIFGDEDLPIHVLNPSSLHVDDGNAIDFDALKQFITTTDLSISSNYQYIESQLDLNNFIDYYIVELFFGNYDWPINNNKIWKAIDSPDKWRQLLFDLDAGFPPADFNMMQHIMRDDPNVSWPNPPQSTVLFRSLFANPAFKSKFVKRIDALLKADLSAESMLKKLTEIKAILEPNVLKQIERWGYPNSLESWQSDITYLSDFLVDRPCMMAKHLNTYLGENELKVSCFVDFAEMENLIIFPNPSDGELKIKFSSGQEADVTIRLTSLEGKLLKEYTFENHHIAQVIILDISSFRQGNYLMDITRGNASLTRKVIKY